MAGNDNCQLVRTVLICPTNKCNLRCKYCYVNKNICKKEIMDIKLIERILRNILKKQKINELNIIWHGGEPLLASVGFFEKAIEIQNRIKQETGVKIINKIQTNGTLIDEKTADFLKKNDFIVSLSIDGPKEIHNSNRIYKNGYGSFERIMKGIKILKDKNIGFNAICVVTSKNIRKPIKLFKFFKELGVDTIRFNEFLDTPYNNFKDLAVSEKNFNKFLIDLFEKYVKDKSNLKVSPLDEIITSFYFGKNNLCTYSKSCAGGFLSINYKGEVFTCNRVLGWKEFRVGNVSNNSFEEMIKNATKIIKKEEISKDCKKCEFKEICWGGCPVSYYFKNDNFDDRKDEICLKECFKYICQRLKSI